MVNNYGPSAFVHGSLYGLNIENKEYVDRGSVKSIMMLPAQYGKSGHINLLDWLISLKVRRSLHVKEKFLFRINTYHGEKN